MSLHPQEGSPEAARSTARPSSPSLKYRRNSTCTEPSTPASTITDLDSPPSRSRSQSMHQSYFHHRNPPHNESNSDINHDINHNNNNNNNANTNANTNANAHNSIDDDMIVLTTPSLRAPPPRSSSRRRHHTRNASTAFDNARRRVVNSLSFESRRSNTHVRLPDQEDDEDYNYNSLPGPQSSSSPPTPPSPTSKSYSWLRFKLQSPLYSLLHHSYFESIVIFLILLSVVVFTIDTAYNVFSHPRPSQSGYFFTWRDYVLFVIFILFSVELLARILAQGLFFPNILSTSSMDTLKESKSSDDNNTIDSSSINQDNNNTNNNNQHHSHSHNPIIHPNLDDPSSVLTPIPEDDDPLLSTQSAYTSYKERIVARLPSLPPRPTLPFIRRSWNRLDLVAVISFWAAFGLSLSGIEAKHSMHLFRALSVLRSFRLLTLSKGTLTILQSLKRSMPLLVNVAFFVMFAIILFAIIGVQAFKGSFRRSCIWVDPQGISNLTLEDQRCGGFIDPITQQQTGFIPNDPDMPRPGAKGYICPLGQVCIEQDSNPQNGIESFDNIFSSMLQNVIIVSVNSWTPIMYNAMDADYFAAFLYFVIAVIFLNFWLVNLFVAVIVYTFRGIVESTKRSAFASTAPLPLITTLPTDEGDNNNNNNNTNNNKEQPSNPEQAQQEQQKQLELSKAQSSSIKRWKKFVKWFNFTKLFWVALVVVDIAFQATKTDTSSPDYLHLLDHLELGFTIAFDVEIIIRILVFMLSQSLAQKEDSSSNPSSNPSRMQPISQQSASHHHILTRKRQSHPYSFRSFLNFLKRPANGVDFLFAVVTTLIQIPPIKDSRAYPWLTFFQVARFYRAIVAIPRMKILLAQVFSSWAGILNMIAFVIVMNFISALVGSELLRGTIPAEDDDGDAIYTSFYQVFNGFLSIFQIMTTEDWTDPLYNAAENQAGTFQVIVTLVFLAGWFIFSNFIVLQLFVAVIAEGFAIDEEARQKAQLNEFVKRSEPPSTTRGWAARWNPYRYVKPAPKSLNVGTNVPSHLLIPLRKTLVNKNQPSQQHRNLRGASTPSETIDSPSGSTVAFSPSESTTRLNQPQSPYLDSAQSPSSSTTTYRNRHRQSVINPAADATAVKSGFKRNINNKRFKFNRALTWLQSLISNKAAKQNNQDLPQDENFKTLNSDDVALKPIRKKSTNWGKSSKSTQNDDIDNDYEDLGRQLDFLGISTRAETEHAQDEMNEKRAQEADFIAAHPGYDTSLFIFSQRNPIRRFCQKLVEPAYGTRIHGEETNWWMKTLFNLTILLAIIASVVIAGISTPKFRRDYTLIHDDVRWSWFNLTESALGLIFILEFLVKVIADGFVFTPNAYTFSFWNGIDLLVLVTLIVNVVTNLIQGGSASRFTRALKAFRALRLINLSIRIRQIFYDVIIVGFGRILDASVLAVLYIIPYAVWGLNLFSGLLYSCNDDSVDGRTQCIGEYLQEQDNWEYLAPRAWKNPYVWSFDSFRSSLLILFEIISLEGWVDVMHSATDISGRDQQPDQFASQFNALFFVAYMLVGGIVILTLFLTIIIRNFSQQAGFLLLSAEQRRWVDLRKLLSRQRPSKRPKQRPLNPFQAWCFDRAVNKKGWWSKIMTCLYVTHVAILMTQSYEEPAWVEVVRNYIFLTFTVVYAIDILVRVVGLRWHSFRRNYWNLYDVAAVAGTFATTIPILQGSESQGAIQLQKLFLVSIAFKLVQKNNSLNQLFKTAIASLPAIGNLFMLWGILFLVWAIFFTEVFGLTKWGENSTWNQNFSTFGKTLVFLTLLSTGEGWNGHMHDYTIEPPFCTPSDNFMFSDCGSAGWAYGLFIIWNILSMYLFMNLFTGVVVDNFSYIYRLQGKASNVNREQMRMFKKAWSEFDKFQTGYVRRQDFVPFFSRLSGIFSVRIYPPEHRIPELVKIGKTSDVKDDDHIVDGFNLSALCRELNKIDYVKVKENRRLYNKLYHEALLSAEPSRGLSFTNMILLLAHYKLIDDDNALQLDELLQRKAKMEKVSDLVNLDRIRGMFQSIILRRKFQAHLSAARAAEANVPAILVDDDNTGAERKRESQMALSLDISAIKNSAPSPPGTPKIHSPISGRTLSPTSPLDNPPGSSTEDSYFTYPASPQQQSPNTTTSAITDEQEYASHLEVSVWGDMMRQAAHDNE